MATITKYIPLIKTVFNDIINEYDLKFEIKNERGIKMYNDHCAFHAGVGRYDDEVITMGVENIESGRMFHFYDIKKIKGEYKYEFDKNKETNHCTLEYCAGYIKSFLTDELEGDFSLLESNI